MIRTAAAAAAAGLAWRYLTDPQKGTERRARLAAAARRTASRVMGGRTPAASRRGRPTFQGPEDTAGEIVPRDPGAQTSMIDEASDESFPSSDPPSYWARDPE